MQESQPNPVKSHITALFTMKLPVKSQKMAPGVGVQGVMTSSECKQYMHKHTLIM